MFSRYASLLSALLSQNPRIYAGGDSPMCQIMWDTYLSYQDKCNREFASNYKHHCLPQNPPMTEGHLRI